MKNYKLLLSMVAGGAMLLFNFTALADGASKDGVVTVASIAGHGQYSIDGGHAWVPLVVGKELPAGSIVRSGDMSVVELLIGKAYSDRVTDILQTKDSKAPAPNLLPRTERNVVCLRPNTTLGIDKLTVPGSDPTVISDCQLDLKKGKILASVKKVSPSSEYLVKLPNGVAAVRGTQLTLSTDGTPLGTTCGVVSGTVWLSFTITGADGTPVLQPDGQPLAPLQISLTPGQSFGLTGALVEALIKAAQGAPPGVSAAVLTATLVDLAVSQESTMSPAEMDTLTVALAAIITPSNINNGPTIAVTVTTEPVQTTPVTTPN